jgi:C-terminal processing protease CtpA/Prc
MATKMKDGGWVGVELDREVEGGPWEVLKVVPESPAEASGMKTGDFLVAMYGIEFHKDNQEKLEKARAEWKPGQSVTYTVRRANENIDLTLTLAPMPADILARYIGEHMLQHATSMTEQAEAAPGS